MQHPFFDFEVYQSGNSDIPQERLSGENQKALLVIAREDDLSEENQQFLAKILSAVKYDLLQDASILKLEKNENISVQQLLSKYDTVLSFGIKVSDIGMSFETILYQPIILLEKKYLIGHSLENIKGNQGYKKALWGALQKVFL